MVTDHERTLDLNHVSAKDIEKITGVECDEPDAKKPKLEEGKKLKGQNKARKNFAQYNPSEALCSKITRITEDEEFPETCQFEKCKFLHKVEDYLKTKPNDIGDDCYNFETFGQCNFGITCRFAKKHVTVEGKNKIDRGKMESVKKDEQVLNVLHSEKRFSLQRKKYDFHLADKMIKHVDGLRKEEKEKKVDEKSVQTSGAVTDEDIVKLLKREKKKIDFKDKLFLSPLTTVGNLPFRRICKEYGADITCGEMAMCSKLLQGTTHEWALVKRHHTEDVFGVQLCGNNPHIFAKCAQLLDTEINVDFIDINLGCPIDMVYREGSGSGLMRRQNVLETCIRSMTNLMSIPLTVKTRTGIYNNTNIAHTLIPKLRDWGASLVTVHGRSREQRYTRSSDWEYIRECAQVASPLPIIGNGDILSYEDYARARESCPELYGVMIGRGALIKPWIFTEIKEQKLYDISSSERFDILKKFTNYGLENWGSDNKGVENTRRFLLEWLSFLYRYIPIGLLESPPQKINERPPYYKGRNDLETLMASPSASDWIKISEMLLGPVPDTFTFLPKHKANAYR